MGSNFDKIWRPSWIPMDIKGQHIFGTKGLTETSNTIFSYDSHVGNSMESSIFEFIYYMTIYSKVLLYFWRKWRNISALIRQNLFCTILLSFLGWNFIVLSFSTILCLHDKQGWTKKIWSNFLIFSQLVAPSTHFIWRELRFLNIFFIWRVINNQDLNTWYG